LGIYGVDFGGQHRWSAERREDALGQHFAQLV
jgi:hypothetical protein